MKKIKSMMKLNLTVICVFLFLGIQYSYSQVRVDPSNRVGIGTSTPVPSAKLEILSEGTGFLKPRMSTAARLGIANPASGLEVYDTEFKTTYWYNGTEWVTCGDGSGGGSGGTKVNAGSNITITGTGSNSDPYIVNTLGEANMATNIGAAGVGLWADKQSVTLRFKKLNASSNMISVTDDVANNKVDINVLPANLMGIPQSGITNLTTDLSAKQANTQYKDEGVDKGTAGSINIIDFVGGGVTATNASGNLTVTIPTQTIPDGDKTDITVSGTGTIFTIDPNTITTSKILDGTIATTDVANDAIDNTKIGNMPTATFKGRTTSGTGDPEDLTIAQAKTMLNLAGTNNGDQTITLTSDVTGTGIGTFPTTIANNAVNNVKLADMATATFKGRTTAGTGDPEDLTVAQAKTMLNLAGTNNGDQTLSLVGNSLSISNGNSVTLPLTGSGTNNYITKWTPNGTTLGNSVISESGGNIGIGITGAGARLAIDGRIFMKWPTSSIDNIVIGASGNPNSIGQTGSNNIFMGVECGKVNTTGSNNIFLGGSAGLANLGGSRNIFLGSNTGAANTTASDNIYIGSSAGNLNATTTDNVMIGRESGVSASGGIGNTFVGTQSGYSNDGNYNACYGYQAGGGVSGVASNNTFMGYQAGLQNITGGNNICVGSNANLSNTNQTYSTSIGANCVVDASNKIWIGRSTIGYIGGPLQWNVPSDQKFKSDIKENVPGISFINKLKPVTYKFDTRKLEENLVRNLPDSIKEKYLSEDFTKSSEGIKTGFIAQDVEKICKEIGYEFDGVHAPEDPTGHYLMSYSSFVVPLVKAVQEQQIQIEGLTKELDSQKAVALEKDRLLEDLLRRIQIIEEKVK